MSPSTYSYFPAILKAGVQRDAVPLPGGLEVSPSTYSYFPAILKAGVQRDAAHCRGSGGVPQHVFVLPRHPQSGSAEGRSPTARRSGGCPPARIRTSPPSSKRECRGRRPLPGVWGCPPEFTILSPLPSGKGAGGMVGATIEAAHLKQESNGAAVQRECRGRRPLPGVWGCPPEFTILSPFLLGRGPGGWSLNPNRAVDRACSA